MLPIILAEHGIRVTRVDASIGRLNDMCEAEGIKFVRHQYSRTSALLTRFGNKARARWFLTMAKDLAALEPQRPLIALGHSQGCRIINDAANLANEDGEECPYKHVIWLSPALDRDTPLAPGIEKADVFFTPHDWTVRLAAWLPFHAFGSMGAYGPDSSDERYRRRVNGSPTVRRHSGWFAWDGMTFLRLNMVQPIIKEYRTDERPNATSVPAASGDDHWR